MRWPVGGGSASVASGHPINHFQHPRSSTTHHSSAATYLKEKLMQTTRLPLALELSKPVLLAGDPDAEFRAQYDSKTQLCSNTRSTFHSASYNGNTGLQVDVSADVQVDDVLG
jgi:hypothetical protein